MIKRGIFLLVLPFLLLSLLPSMEVRADASNWQDEAIYYITVDRYFNKDRVQDEDIDHTNLHTYQGGDFKGITAKLDYIKDMGFTMIALNPIIENTKDGYHGHWPLDFTRINHHYGTLADFKQLVKEAHDRDMKVMVEFGVNHVGPNHHWLDKPAKKEWFHPKRIVTKDATGTEAEKGWIDGLPDLAQENPEVEAYLINAAKWWIEETNLDGYLLEEAQYVQVSFWEAFNKEMKAVKSDFYLLGSGSIPTEEVKAAGFDGWMNKDQQDTMRKSFAEPDQELDGLFPLWKEQAEDSSLPKTAIRLDHTQSTRFTQDIAERNQFPGTRWKLALTYLYTTPGVPVLFYGSEIALNGGTPPDNQKLMNFRTEKELIDYITKLNKVREQYPALRKGELTLLGEENGMAVYKREHKGEVLIVAINNSSKTGTITLEEDVVGAEKELRGRLADQLVRNDNGSLPITLNRETTEIYLVAGESGINYVYFFAIAMIFVLFGLFLFAAWKKGQNTAD